MRTSRYRSRQYREWKRKYDIEYRKRTANRRRKRVAEYFAKNKTKIRTYLNVWQNRWRKTFRGRISMRVSNAMRRKRVKATSDGTITRRALEALFDNQNGKCAICRCKLIPQKMHLDHKVPLVSGGRHSLVNVQWTCAACNLAKHKQGMKCRPENFPHIKNALRVLPY